MSIVERIRNRLRARRYYSLVKSEFDSSFYLERNPDVQKAGLDPVMHYLLWGWREFRDPRPDFSTKGYLQAHPDVAISGMNPFHHFIAFGRNEGRTSMVAGDFLARAPHILQDRTFPLDAETAEAVMVILIPEHNEMSGGIYSFFSIAKAAHALRHKHNYRILLMTRPNWLDETYLRQRNFRNSEDVFRFSQITRCRQARTVYLHIPEYAAPSFVESLDKETLGFLRSRERLFVNILNQKTDIMPPKEAFEDLRAIATEITQSVAHHAYFGQEFADRYDLPTLLLPAYTDLSAYDAIPFEEKERLIIYSPDSADYRGSVLEALKTGLPDYRLQEIRGITFDRYMDLATLCRFSITFGEGFDGYLAQPIYQGGVGFAVYNEEFFPSKEIAAFPNIFVSGAEMASDIVRRIRTMESDREAYAAANRMMMRVYDRLYSKEDYTRRVEMLIKREFELYPLHLGKAAPVVRL